jgi:peptidoglycan lytic transglycosylase
MRLPRNNPRARLCVCVATLILSLGGASNSFGQMVGTNPPAPQTKIEGMATWYKVPAKSTTKQRAGKGELTAAHSRLPYGTLVRVTHIANGKNVVVRITDRGVYRRGVVIDLCKEAAEKLDMLREGSTKVRLEVLPDDKAPKDPTQPSHRWWWW